MADSSIPISDFDSEIVIGLTGAVGTNRRKVTEILTSLFAQAGYNTHVVQISTGVIPALVQVEYQDRDEFDRLNSLMDAGNLARKQSGDPGILALGAAAYIGKFRRDSAGPGNPIQRTAFIVASLKRPEEVEWLRQIYREGFVLLGVHSTETMRKESLMSKGISDTHASQLIERDADEKTDEHGQRLTKTFHLADFFTRIHDSERRLICELRRIINCLFGDPFATPTFDELSMFQAFASAVQSADLSRQVGAVIAREDQILSTGANECPRAGGGFYWPTENDHGCLHDAENGRDYKRGADSNDLSKIEMANDILRVLERAGLDEKVLTNLGMSQQVLRDAINAKDCAISDITEYGRVVHAEMAAIMNCARSGASTQGATLYCTTFPCHNCAKHIVASGIRRVVYIEPYEKSRAKTFHNDSAVFDFEVAERRTSFEPFTGIGPRRFLDIFSMNMSSGYGLERKVRATGRKVDWTLGAARLRISAPRANYLIRELEANREFSQLLVEKMGVSEVLDGQGKGSAGKGSETDSAPAVGK